MLHIPELAGAIYGSLATAGMAALVLTIAALPAAAEFVMEQCDGVLHVKNVEPPAPPATSKNRPGAVAASVDSYRALIRETAERHALAPALVESVIRVESNFEPRAVSPNGARGLMQLMPATAAQLGVHDVFGVGENIDAGVRHLRYLLDLYRGNVPFALAAYNAGVDAVARYSGIPPYAETQAYVARVLRLLQRAGPSASAEARMLHRYEAADGRVVYSNLPVDKLSSAARAMLEGRE